MYIHFIRRAILITIFQASFKQNAKIILSLLQLAH